MHSERLALLPRKRGFRAVTPELLAAHPFVTATADPLGKTRTAGPRPGPGK